MAAVTIYDHVVRGLLLIPTYWEDREVAKGVLAAFLEELNPIEEAADQLRNNFTISNGEGVTLDIIGELFLVERNGRSDEDYRKAILREGILFYSDGTMNQLMEVTNSYTNRDDGKLIDYGHGLAFAQVKGGFDDEMEEFLDTNATAAGVKLKVAVDLGQTMLARSAPQTLLVDDQENVIQVNGYGEDQDLTVSSGNDTWQMPICWVL